jgi:hypothetical protein
VRCRPLPGALLQYACTDVHYLLYIADCLGVELARRDGQLTGTPSLQQGAQQAQQHLEAGQGLQEAGQGLQEAGQGLQEEQQAYSEQGGTHSGSSSGSAAPEEGSSNKAREAAQPAGSEAAGTAGGPSASLFRELHPGSKLWHAVQRSQALSLNVYRPLAPRAAAELAALTVMRRHISELRAAGQLERPEASRDESADSAGANGARGAVCLNAAERREVEVVGDCVFALCEWRDALARSLDEGGKGMGSPLMPWSPA